MSTFLARRDRRDVLLTVHSNSTRDENENRPPEREAGIEEGGCHLVRKFEDKGQDDARRDQHKPYPEKQLGWRINLPAINGEGQHHYTEPSGGHCRQQW